MSIYQTINVDFLYTSGEGEAFPEGIAPSPAGSGQFGA